MCIRDSPGSAEQTLGALLRDDLRAWRDELIISTKAGYTMGPGPYGDWGSRKYLLTSLDQSLHRMGLDYVDIFYHHRPDPNTPLHETMGALDALSLIHIFGCACLVVAIVTLAVMLFIDAMLLQPLSIKRLLLSI